MKTINEQIYDALEETMHPASIPHVDYDGCDLRLDGEFSVSDLEKIIQVINGDYEPKIKTVSLDWLVGSGIDCDFSNNDNKWRFGGLYKVDGQYYDYWITAWNKCRPRLNRPMVLTDKQLNLIPAGFDLINGAFVNDVNIVTFKGLKDGYKYEWEV